MKPRLIKTDGKWMCCGVPAVGIGRSIILAYADWVGDVKLAERQWENIGDTSMSLTDWANERLFQRLYGVQDGK